MRHLKKYKPTKFKAKDSVYDKEAADFAVMFIEQLCHTKGTWAGKPFELIDWQEQIIRDIFGILKPNGYRQFNTAYVEIPKKMGKSELAAAIALLLTCGDGEERAEVYGCAADRQQAAIVFDVAADMVRMCPALNKRVKILTATKRIVYAPTNSFSYPRSFQFFANAFAAALCCVSVIAATSCYSSSVNSIISSTVQSSFLQIFSIVSIDTYWFFPIRARILPLIPVRYCISIRFIFLSMSIFHNLL